MAFSRYKYDDRISFGNQLGIANGVRLIRERIRTGALAISNQIVLTGSDRLDILSGNIYGDSSYWWVLAAASDIGWGMQVPPGTVIKIVDLRSVEGLVG